MKRPFLAALVWLAVCVGSLAAWDTRPEPILPDGKPIMLVLPASEHMSNVGGSDGAGLCVYTSVTLSAKWHNITGAYNLRKFAEGRPGGSYPEKLAADIKTYSTRYHVTLPNYVQHTGGDDAFLDLCMLTRRYPGITYSGKDDFYRGPIAHMVNLVSLDKAYGSIQDNNRAGKWTSDTREKVLNRWKGRNDDGSPMRSGRFEVGGGWAFVWLAPPAPPVPTPSHKTVLEARKVGSWERVILGDTFKWDEDFADRRQSERDVIVWVYWLDGQPVGGFHKRVFREVILRDGEPFALGDPKPCPCGVCPPCDEMTDDTNNGIDIARVSQTPRYWINDVEVGRDRAYAAVIDVGDGLTDDSDKYHLSIVGPASDADRAQILKKFGVGGSAEKYARRLHIQVYTSTDWPAKNLSAPVTLQEPAKIGGKIVGVAKDWTDDSLKRILGDVFDPPPPPAPPKPPEPEPIVPAPKPEPAPAPTPAPAPLDWRHALLAALLAILVWRK
jgi:hypothetical protein